MSKIDQKLHEKYFQAWLDIARKFDDQQLLLLFFESSPRTNLMRIAQFVKRIFVKPA